MPASREIMLDNGCPAYLATPDSASAPGVVVSMEVFGLTAHIRDVCDRLAAAGFVALAPDYYRGRLVAYDDAETAFAMLRGLDDEGLIADQSAGLDALVRHVQVDRRKLAAVGFCMGGRAAFLAACRLPSKVSAVVSLYGGGIAPSGPDRLGRRRPIEALGGLRAPALLIYGGRDASIGVAEHLNLVQAFAAAGKPYTLSLYPEAGHGFCCAERPAYHAASAEAAYAEVFGFLRRTFRSSQAG